MKILFLTFYFEPDLCAGSFRNTPLAEILNDYERVSEVHVVTTIPNRYSSYKVEVPQYEERGKLKIHRIAIPAHKSGFMDQVKSFFTYFISTFRITYRGDYDLVYASSSRLFTAFLGRIMSIISRSNLYLDIRDIFTDTLSDVIKSRVVRTLLLPVLNIFERFTFSKANHINLVSKGFEGYFEKYSYPKYSYYSNGIDKVFIETQKIAKLKYEGIITYAGNIGEGQGLEKIIPEAAKKLPNYTFRIIGDGGTRNLLEDSISSVGLNNVEIINPVSRTELIDYYLKSDFLFFHLNDYPAFKKVLPSKVFEYGSFNVPIIAGVSGYAAQFVKENLTNYILFDPQNTDELVTKLNEFQYRSEKRSEFVNTFSRKNIMGQMASSILSIS